MKRIAVIVYTAVVVSLAVATFLSPAVYGSWWFILLWVAFAGVLVAAAVVSRMWCRPGVFILHLSFIAMLGGGLLTWLTREKGSVRIPEGESVSAFVCDDGRDAPLPEEIRLERFEVLYYPGGVAPRDYVSHLSVAGKPFTVSMNNILDLRGYRFCQSSFDSSGATVLSVNHDPYGMPLSYAGYAMFAVGGLLVLVAPRGRFRMLLRSLAVVSLLLVSGGVGASASKIAGVPLSTADSLKTRQVVYGGRTVTFNTLSRDVVTKLYGKPSYRGLSPEQTLLSLRLYPGEWKNEPLLLVKDRRVREALGLQGKYAALSDLFDSVGNYRVEPLYGCLGEKGRRAVEELDEKVGIVLMLYSGELIVTPSPSEEPLPDWRVRLELFYNAVPFSTLIFIFLFTGAVFAFLSQLGRPVLRRVAKVLLCVSLAVSVACFVLQWILSDRLPVSNTFETLQFSVMVLELLVLLFSRSGAVLAGLGMLFAGALALVAHLVEVNPVVTPLMPVLHSSWLSLHVSLVMTAYSLLGFTFVIAVMALVRPSTGERMRRLSLAMLYPGVWLLGMGIFSGAVWADVSWGQYWSWDPKETWALITMLTYAVPLHASLHRLRTPRNYHLYLLFAILTVAMTYFGVNHLDSLHAYN